MLAEKKDTSTRKKGRMIAAVAGRLQPQWRRMTIEASSEETTIVPKTEMP